MNAIYGEAVAYDSGVLGASDSDTVQINRPPVLRIVRQAASVQPAWSPAARAPIGEFALDDDVVFVRSVTGLVGAIALDGSRITYYHDEPDDANAIVSVLDEFSALAMDLRGELCLHAALIVSGEGRGVVLLGDSGTGKSTATMIAARHPDWSAASDDSLLIRVDGRKVIGVPCYPGIRLLPDSIERLGLAEKLPAWDRLPKAGAAGKRQLGLSDCQCVAAVLHEGAVSIKAIVDLRPSGDAQFVELSQVTPGEMVGRLIWSAIAVPVLGQSAEIRRFDHAVRVANLVECHVARYPKSPESIAELLERL